MPRLIHLALLLAAAALPAPAQDPTGWPPAPPLAAPGALDPGPLPRSVTARPAGPGRWRCTFRFQPLHPARAVTLAGTFNGWDPRALPMQRSADGTWQAEVELGAGVHQYKFVVDGDRWCPDPANPDSADDGHGGRNSVLRLGPLARLDRSPASVGDGAIAAFALEHDPAAPFFLQHLSGGRLLLRYRTLAHDVAAVALAVRGRPPVPMAVVLEEPLQATWEAVLPPPLPPPGTPYTFLLRDGETVASHPEPFAVPPPPPEPFRTPDWAKGAVWYQIMPDRFRNGDPANDPDPVRPWTSEWFTPSPWEGRDGQDFYHYYAYRRFYGGDLQGILEKLDYLAELGVDALYLTPVFQAGSYHRYDATDWRHVDEHLGAVGDYAEVAAREDLLDPSTWEWTASDRIFLDFLRQAHARGFKVIIDGVFNHVGTAHPAFQDVRRRGRESPYADWFDVVSWEPFRYRGWAGFGELPAFRKSADGLASPTLKAHIFAVTRRWMDPDGDGDPSDGVDGWRLDVPNEIPMPFWAEWRRLVKSINPDAYISGEIWDRADAWLDGRHFDAVMNYEFARAVLAWIGNDRDRIPVSELDRRLARLRLAYPAEATAVLMNLLDSHDTDRLVSMIQNPDRPYDRRNRPQDDNPAYDNSRPGPEAWRRARLAVLIQATYPGAPMIWYGDEAGMWGADDPTNRKPMLWEDLEPYADPEDNHVDREHLAWYRQVLGLRRELPALRRGGFRTLRADDAQETWVFLREAPGAAPVLVAVHAGGGAGPGRGQPRRRPASGPRRLAGRPGPAGRRRRRPRAGRAGPAPAAVVGGGPGGRGRNALTRPEGSPTPLPLTAGAGTSGRSRSGCTRNSRQWRSPSRG